MPFYLSPASLVDQRGFDYTNLFVWPNSTTPSAALPFTNLSIPTPIDATIPQIFVVNPSSDNIFRHVNPQSAHAAIIGLIYFSMWMGALGWDIVSTISFDFRLVKETTWSSGFSCIYSIAYLLSRYVSLAWLVTAVTNSVIMTNHCDAWMKGSTALFSVAISATMLVFCLRACSIWHMQQKIVSLVVSAWFLVVAFAVLLPIMSGGTQLPTSNFCAWHFNGLYVVGVFGALLIFDLLCLIVTVCKLNKAGWRGLLHGLFPSSRHNLDAEDVKTMLVQKTTAFFAIQFLFLISALLVYVLTDTYAYRMMNIVASVAVASSMAGRIFRRAWRQTRELAPHNINRPPSYFPAWAEEHRGASFSRNDVNSVYTPSNDPTRGNNLEGLPPKPARVSRSKDKHEKHDSLAFYVEGEFRPQLKPRTPSSLSLRSISRSPTSLGATQQMREMEVGHAGMDAHTDAVSITPSTIVIARNNLVVPHRRGSEPLRDERRTCQSGPAPAYSRRLGSSASSRPRTGERDALATFSTQRPTSAGEISRQQSAPNLQTRLNTAPSQSHPTNSSPNSSDSLTLEADPQSIVGFGPSAHDDDFESEDQHGFVMDEKRRTFITSPPLSAGLKPNRKEVYDFDSVKAAAHFGTRPMHLRRFIPRPATASSIPPASAFDSAALNLTPPGRVQFASAAEQDAHRRGATGDSFGSPNTKSFAFLNQDPLVQDQQGTPRPKTAPNWSSPSVSPSESVVSQMTVMPRGLISESGPSGVSLAPSPLLAAPAADENALFAFLNTVEEDSRDRAASHSHGPQAPPLANLAVDDGRPRTSRGNTASSSQSFDSSEDQESDSRVAHVIEADARGRRASASARPRSGTSPRESKNVQIRTSSAAGLRSCGGTSDGSSSGNRPSTAVGDAVKPFGYGLLASSSRRGSQARSLRDRTPCISDDEPGEAEAESEAQLGSVIEKEYAKLAARAQLPLD